MIELHRLNGEIFVLNPDLIETIETTPDTVVRLLNGHRYLVKEPTDYIIKTISEFRSSSGYARIPMVVVEEEG
ncbi:MAG: flagellar FlbD family protein [Synergistaceae bacterium]|nr:flagellar FlbD family protein [Synergistaceae bacterium]